MDSSVKPADVLSVCVCVSVCETNEERDASAGVSPSAVFDVAAAVCAAALVPSAGAGCTSRNQENKDSRREASLPRGADERPPFDLWVFAPHDEGL